MGSQSDENTSNMESDSQPLQHVQLDQLAISSQKTMSNNIEDTYDDNQLSEYEVHVARRYSVLMRTFNDIFSMASLNEKAYRYVLGMAREVMSKVEELVSEEIQSDQLDGNQLPRNEASKVALEATSRKPIKKKDRERGQCQYPSSLETNKKKRKIDKSINLLNSRYTEMSLNPNLSAHGLTYGMHALSQESSLLDSHITVAPSNLTGLEK